MQLHFDIPVSTTWGKDKKELSEELKYLISLGRKEKDSVQSWGQSFSKD